LIISLNHVAKPFSQPVAIVVTLATV